MYKLKLYRPLKVASTERFNTVAIDAYGTTANKGVVTAVFTESCQIRIEAYLEDKYTGEKQPVVAKDAGSATSAAAEFVVPSFDQYKMIYRSVGYLNGTTVTSDWKTLELASGALAIDTIGALVKADGGVMIEWTTNVPADSQIEWWILDSADPHTKLVSENTIKHIVLIESVSVGSTYCFTAESTSPDGQTVKSEVYKFQTFNLFEMNPFNLQSSTSYSRDSIDRTMGIQVPLMLETSASGDTEPDAEIDSFSIGTSSSTITMGTGASVESASFQTEAVTTLN